jgi:uncharacterized membrane protein YoaK (UPF0700 family)
MDHPLRTRLSVLALLLFTASTGVVDAVSYLGLDRVFTGNMTGNVLFLGFALVGVPGIPFLNNAIALLGFVAGSIVSGRIVGRGHRAGTLPTGSIVVLAVSAAILVAITVVAAFVPSLPEPVLLGVTASLAFAMGGQVSAVKPVGNSDITTIVVTNTIANLARDSRLGGGDGQRWVQRLLAVVAMGAGAALGALIVINVSTALALALAAVVFTSAGVVMVVATKAPDGTHPSA